MTSITDEFKVFDYCVKSVKQNIKLFHVFETDFGICVTNDDIVFAYGTGELIETYLGYNYQEQFDQFSKTIHNTIIELCDENIEQFFCCFHCLFAISSDNKVFAAGDNEFGQIGQGYKSQEYLKPKKIKFFDNKNIIDISCGVHNCLALSSEGLVYGWGDNSHGQFDNSGDFQRFLTPVLINSEFGVNERVKHIHCCIGTSVLVTFNGLVYFLKPDQDLLKVLIPELSEVNKIYLNIFNSAFVLKNNGFIEYFSKTERKSFDVSLENVLNSHYYSNELDHELIIPTNEGIKVIKGITGNVLDIKDKKQFEYILLKNESTFTTIHLKENSIYYKDFELNQNTRTLVQTMKRIDFNVEEYHNKYHNSEDSENLRKFGISKCLPQILDSKVEYYHQIGEIFPSAIFFVMNNNKVYSIGCNNNCKQFQGILGLGHKRNVFECTLIEELCEQNIEEFFEGNGCMFARTDKNQIFSWGDPVCGQLCRPYSGETFESFKPKKIEFFDDKNIIDIRCGYYHCLALSEDGRVYGWGKNVEGQIRSPNEYQLTPIEVKICDSSENRIKFINCHGYTSCAVTVDGRAFIWGRVGKTKIVTPKLIETKVSKIYLNSVSKSSLIYSILTTNGLFRKKRIFKTRNGFNKKNISKSEGVVDIYGTETILKEDAVYEVFGRRNVLRKTIFSTFYEYFYSESKRIVETIHITSDGYLKRPIIEINLNSNQTLLKKVYKNIFEQKFGNSFEMIEMIGEGGYGKVFKVKNKANNNLYAIKTIEIKDDIRKTLKEIEIMSQLRSEYIVNFYDSWTEAQVVFNHIQNYLFIQMELCSQNLGSIIKLINGLSEEKFKTIKYFIRSELLVEVIECLNYLHSRKVIHRDFKTQNILITDGINKRIVKLCDFGLSKVYENSQNTCDIGTRQSMAPEVLNYDQKTGKSCYTLKSDIYSLGVVAKELFDLKETNGELKSFDSYSTYFSNSLLNEKFSKLYKEISIMLSTEPEERLSCSELLPKTNEWTVDQKTIKKDKNYNQFIRFTENDENLNILKSFVDFKTIIHSNECINEFEDTFHSSLRISN